MIAFCLFFVLFWNSCFAAIKQCSSLETNLGLDVAATPIDASVDWQPRFAGRAGKSELVFVVTKKKSLYISTDDGVNWDGPLNVDHVRMPPPSIGAQTNVTGMHFTAMPASQFYVMADDNGKTFFWTTNDGGKTFKVNKNEKDIVWIAPHRSLAHVALGYSYTSTYQLSWLTTDFGLSWKQVGDNTTFMTQFACDEANCQHDDALLYQNSRGKWDDCGSGNCQLVKQSFNADKPSEQALGVRSVLYDACNGLTQVKWPWYDASAKRIIFASTRSVNPAKADNVEVKVYFSSDLGHSWTLARFPFGTQPHHYRFITTEQDVLMAGVRSTAAGEDVDYGTLYVSSNGLEKGMFVESLRYVRFSPKRWWEESMFAGNLDVERSAELDGVFLANRYRTNSDGSPNLDCTETVITQDFGATWSKLKAPADANCPANRVCNLHVRLDVREFPTAYSPSDAVGLWLAQGNVGECLSSEPEATFMSADGGSNWSTMAKERLIYEVSNHGALVAGAATERPTNELVYTLNDGKTFERCQFRAVNMTVNNILTRSFNARNFIMEGRNDENLQSYGLLIHFNFNMVHERECIADDYVKWSPAECLLGRHLVWQRRKITSECHNPIEREITGEEYACKCKEEDYECDYCYEIGPDGKCRLESTVTCQAEHDNPTYDCVINNSTEYVVSDGYRLQPNNKCSGGVQHGEVKACPQREPAGPASGGSTGIVLAILAVGVVLAAIVGGGIYVYLKRRKAAMSYASMVDDDE